MAQHVADAQSDSEQQKKYRIFRKSDGALYCECPAHRIQKREGGNGLDCKHITRARADLGKGGVKVPVFIGSPYWTRRDIKEIWRKGSDIRPAQIEKIPTGEPLLDDLLGGGMPKGCTTLLSGGPGCGKSILAGRITASMAHEGRTCTYAVGEEPPENYLARLKHYGTVLPEKVLVGETAYIGDVESGVEKFKPEVLIVDSLQAHTYEPGQSSTPLVQQNILQRLIKLARVRHLACLVIGHYTKGGDIKGGLGVQHDVDCVIKIQKDPDLPQERIVYVEKNRNGPNGVSIRYSLTKTEIKIFEDRAAAMSAELIRAKRMIEADFGEAADD